MRTGQYKEVHHQFRLNGFYLNADDLCRVAYSFIKEGEDYERAVGSFLLDWFDEREWVEIQTSGTTGDPKRIQVSKQAMVASALATGAFFDLQPGDRVLHCLSTQFIAGKMMFVRAFVLGLDLDLVAPSGNPLAHNDQKYDFAALVPLQTESALNRLENVKKVIIGGARVSPVLERKLIPLKCEVYETYGMTETITHIAAKKVGEAAFTVLPGVTISHDENHCLVINAPRISAEVIVTRDLVELVNEHQFRFLGRADHVVNSGGIKLVPEQIEARLHDKIPGRFFVAGQPDERLGEKLVLFIEGEEQPLPSDIFSGLSKYERPKEVHFLKAFSETGSGKIIRKVPV